MKVESKGKAKGPAACNSQTASPFGCLNNFCLTFRGHFKNCLAVVFEGMKSIWSCFSNLKYGKRRNAKKSYSPTLTNTPPLRQDSVAALAMRTGRRPSIAPTAVWVSLLIASTKEITWLMNAWL